MAATASAATAAAAASVVACRRASPTHTHVRV